MSDSHIRDLLERILGHIGVSDVQPARCNTVLFYKENPRKGGVYVRVQIQGARFSDEGHILFKYHFFPFEQGQPIEIAGTDSRWVPIVTRRLLHGHTFWHDYVADSSSGKQRSLHAIETHYYHTGPVDPLLSISTLLVKKGVEFVDQINRVRVQALLQGKTQN